MSLQLDSIFGFILRPFLSFEAFSPVSILGYSCADGASGNRLKRTLTPSYGLTSKGMLCHQVASIFGFCFRIRSQTAVLYVTLIWYVINYTEKRIIWQDPSMRAPVFLDLAWPLLDGCFPKKILSHNIRGVLRYDTNIHLVG